MVLNCRGDTMAEIQKEENSEERQQEMARDFASCMQEDVSPSSLQATAVGSQSPSPSIRAGSLALRRGQFSGFNRSLTRSSRRSGNWTGGMDTIRLSAGWSSTRRKGLKEILLQTSQAKPTWLTASQRENVPVDNQQDQDVLLDANSEDLSFVLDPLEHEWMLTVAQGDAENILRLLAKDSSLLSRKDFVTGFTVLHWLAKHGRHEDLIEVIAFAEKNRYPVDVDVLTASGRFTPLHLAALQGHEMVVKVLVGAYGANTGLRDHNGRKAWQYLRADAPRELKELLGACEEDLACVGEGNANNNCAPSRRGTLHMFKGGAGEASGRRQNQGAVPRLSFFRNVFRQAIAFFQDL
nr:ankyrin repeat domain-containing protein SOWAHD [Pogona vitticeps]